MKFEQIIEDLKRKIYHPVYWLQGEEDYFIDQISDHIEKNVLEEAERDFNLNIFYGLDTEIESVISAAKRYPMMASHNVVIVKEAQNLKKIEEIEPYISNPTPTTILVLVYKYKKIDKRKSLAKQLSKKGIVFTSDKLYEDKTMAWAERYAKSKKLVLSPKSSAILVESLGTDLSKISNEINKLALILKENEEISPEVIEKNIGLSKDYNVFELNKALAELKIEKANRIIFHFSKNPKAYPIQMLLPGLYMFFSKLLLYHSVKGNQDRVIASKLGVNPFFLKDYKVAAQNYSIKKLARVIAYLRDCDNRSKGIGSANVDQSGLLKELVFKILH